MFYCGRLTYTTHQLRLCWNIQGLEAQITGHDELDTVHIKRTT
jgi:hypothetical protein